MRGNPVKIDLRKILAARHRGHIWRSIAETVDLFAVMVGNKPSTLTVACQLRPVRARQIPATMFCLRSLCQPFAGVDIEGQMAIDCLYLTANRDLSAAVLEEKGAQCAVPLSENCHP